MSFQSELVRVLLSLGNVLIRGRRCTGGRMNVWAQCFAVVGVGAGIVASLHAQAPERPASKTPPLSIEVDDNPMTTMITMVPQVYLSGVIDAGAPRRFAALVRSGKIPEGSNVYLDSLGGNLAAGLELGRQFRKASLITALGRRNRDRSGKESPKWVSPGICVSACSYAYFGGLYRIAPGSTDRFGIHQFYWSNTRLGDVGEVQQASGEVVSYLNEMGINPNVFSLAATASREEVVWLTGNQMIQTGLANNGRLPITAMYRLQEGLPYLVLDQKTYEGEHKIILLCGPSGVLLTSFYLVGADRAKEVLARGARSYFEINRREILPIEQGGAEVANASIGMQRGVPLAFMAQLLTAESIGAWLNDKNGAFRYGFTMELDAVRSNVRDYYANCGAIAKPAG